MITGTNDEYWPLDATSIYYDELVGEKHLLYMPDAGHGLDEDVELLLGSLASFVLKADGRLTYPVLEWEFTEANGIVELAITSDVDPESVMVLVATSEDRDFRDSGWVRFTTSRVGDRWVYGNRLPDRSRLAIFGQATYVAGEIRYVLSTSVRIY